MASPPHRSHRICFSCEMRCLITDEQITATLHPPHTLAGELHHRALDVLIQDLVADLDFL